MRVKYLLGALGVLFFVMACGSVPAVVEKSPAPAKFQGQISPLDEKTINTPSPSVLVVLGASGDCWNVRTGPGISWPVLTRPDGSEVYVCGGDTVTTYGFSDNGFVKIAGGYVCNRALGTSVECR